MADMPQPEAGLSKSEVEEIVKAAVAAIPQPDPGLTSAEAEQIARGVVASIPPKSAPADYTRYFVMGGPLSLAGWAPLHAAPPNVPRRRHVVETQMYPMMCRH